MARRNSIGPESYPSGPICVERRHPLQLPSDDTLRKSCPQLWTAYDARFPDATRPLAGRIWLEITRRMSYVLSDGKDLWASILPPDFSESDAKFVTESNWLVALPERQRMNAEVSELLGLVAPPLRPADRSQLADNILTSLIRDAGFTASQAKPFMQRRKRDAGRPPNRRYLALRALEVQILEPGLTWNEIGSRLGYTRECQRPVSETLPAEVRHVKRVLQRYGLRNDRRRPSQ